MRSVPKQTDEAATLRDEWERGFGTKKAASTERPGSDPGSVWHLLSGESWLGAEGENHGSRRCRKSPTLEAAQN